MNIFAGHMWAFCLRFLLKVKSEAEVKWANKLLIVMNPVQTQFFVFNVFSFECLSDRTWVNSFFTRVFCCFEKARIERYPILLYSWEKKYAIFWSKKKLRYYWFHFLTISSKSFQEWNAIFGLNILEKERNTKWEKLPKIYQSWKSRLKTEH